MDTRRVGAGALAVLLGGLGSGLTVAAPRTTEPPIADDFYAARFAGEPVASACEQPQP